MTPRFGRDRVFCRDDSLAMILDPRPACLGGSSLMPSERWPKLVLAQSPGLDPKTRKFRVFHAISPGLDPKLRFRTDAPYTQS